MTRCDRLGLDSPSLALAASGWSAVVAPKLPAQVAIRMGGRPVRRGDCAFMSEALLSGRPPHVLVTALPGGQASQN